MQSMMLRLCSASIPVCCERRFTTAYCPPSMFEAKQSSGMKNWWIGGIVCRLNSSRRLFAVPSLERRRTPSVICESGEVVDFPVCEVDRLCALPLHPSDDGRTVLRIKHDAPVAESRAKSSCAAVSTKFRRFHP